MTEPTELDPLSASLDALHRFVAEHPEQTLHRMAENAVLHWARVAESKDGVQPRLSSSGYAPGGFAFGMETRRENQIDPVLDPFTPESYAAGRQARLDALRERLEKFFAHTGYRSSSDQCDQMMLEVARVSRFFSAHCQAAERAALAGRSPAEPGPRIDIFAGLGAETLLYQARYHLAYWEPLLNEPIVCWLQNTLEEYEHALTELAHWLREPAAGMPHALGFPVRAQGRARQRTSSFHPEQRPLRGKSMFNLRFNQLLKRLDTSGGLPLRVALQLDTEIRQFLQMAERNHYLLTAEPTFQQVGRAALSLIRSRPSTHPALADPVDFFKKAVLFANGTYTVAGGGIDPMYLQLRQLERYYRFENWASGRRQREPLERALLHWEENRWDGFTGELMELAERLRAGAAG